MTTPATPLDLGAVRAAFPSLADGEVFLDNAGGSQTLGVVVERMVDYLLTSNVQHGASYATSRLALDRFDEGVAAMARWVNAASPDEIVMGPSTTSLLDTCTVPVTFECSMCTTSSSQWQSAPYFSASRSARCETRPRNSS